MLLVSSDSEIIQESRRVKRTLRSHALKKHHSFWFERGNGMELNSDKIVFDWPYTFFYIS